MVQTKQELIELTHKIFNISEKGIQISCPAECAETRIENVTFFHNGSLFVNLSGPMSRLFPNGVIQATIPHTKVNDPFDSPQTGPKRLHYEIPTGTGEITQTIKLPLYSPSRYNVEFHNFKDFGIIQSIKNEPGEYHPSFFFNLSGSQIGSETPLNIQTLELSVRGMTNRMEREIKLTPKAQNIINVEKIIFDFNEDEIFALPEVEILPKFIPTLQTLHVNMLDTQGILLKNFADKENIQRFLCNVMLQFDEETMERLFLTMGTKKEHLDNLIENYEYLRDDPQYLAQKIEIEKYLTYFKEKQVID